MMGAKRGLPQIPHACQASRRLQVVPIAQQRGVIAIMFSIFLIVMIGILALALDLSRVYNRHGELQVLADTAALAAARQLAGTSASLDQAVLAAQAATTALKYDYDRVVIPWSASALTFGRGPSGPWMDASAAKAAPADVVFARVDTSQLADLGVIRTFFMQMLDSELANTNTGAKAVAGRATINVTPLAICAMSNTAAESLGAKQELVQYGFRRGVGYNLMNLAKTGSTPANYLINPFDPADRPGELNNTSTAVVGPFVCAGTLSRGHILGGDIRVSHPFPIASLYQHLNSRFGDYNAGYCKAESAPPDINVKSYPYTAVTWMKTAPLDQTAATSTESDGIRTIADTATGGSAAQYGLLWAFARPAPFSAYVAGVAEPAAGYTPFIKADWKLLYPSGQPEPKTTYPSSTAPYDNRAPANFAAPSSLGVLKRRVLNIPLLDCPVGTGTDLTASVLAIGRFFMTVPATSQAISAEFAGIATADTLGGTVELY